MANQFGTLPLLQERLWNTQQTEDIASEGFKRVKFKEVNRYMEK